MSFGPQAQDFLQKKVVNSLWCQKNIESLLIINYLSPKMDHVQQRGQTKTTLLALPEVKQKQKKGSGPSKAFAYNQKIILEYQKKEKVKIFNAPEARGPQGQLMLQTGESR